MTVIGDAFSGVALAVSGQKVIKSHHKTFIEGKLIPHTVKLQKETGWRRYKESQKTLQEALLALRDFQKEEWPPKKVYKNDPKSSLYTAKEVGRTEPNETTDDTDTAITVESEDISIRDDLSHTSSPCDSGAHSTNAEHITNVEHISNANVIVVSPQSESNGLSPSDFEANNTSGACMSSEKLAGKKTPSINHNINDTMTEITINSQQNVNIKDETNQSTCRENIESAPVMSEGSAVIDGLEQCVHPAIVKTIEAYLSVLAHPAYASRPIELVMEGISMMIEHHYFSGIAGGTADLSGSGRQYVSRGLKEMGEIPPPSLVHRVLQGIAEVSQSNSDTVQSAVLKTLTTIVTSPVCKVHEGSLLLAMRSAFHVFLVTKSQACKDNARSELFNMLRAVFVRAEAYDAVLRSNAVMYSQYPQSPEPHRQILKIHDLGTIVSPSSTNQFRVKTDESVATSTPGNNQTSLKMKQSFPSQYHADAYFLFRALCKLSSKELLADDIDESERKNSLIISFNSSSTDPTELNSKILALELILAALEVCGEACTSGEKFLILVQNYLSSSLLKNCVSNNTQVAFLSQRIFLVQVYKFKDYLKQDIEIFMSTVFFRVLESPNSSFKQKALILESLRTLCKDPVNITQIFLNYDCDFDSMSLYKDIIEMLTKLAGKATSVPSSSLSKKDVEREFELSLAALECLVNILKTLLRALGLPGSEGEEESIESAGIRVRSMLNLSHTPLPAPTKPLSSVVSSDNVLSDDESEHCETLTSNSKQQRESYMKTDVAGQIVDTFDRKRNAQKNFEIGCVKFTLSLKSGLNYFIDHGFVALDAQEIAHFFLANKDKLDKTQLGEALGREPQARFVKDEKAEADKGGEGFWVRILHYYASSMDFSGMRFDDAIRLFLSGFRLPGEAQKIDRIMEKFAERFTSQNPDIFPSSDTAFILAFSVIMLNTDLHNPNIKPEKRMTVDSFIRNNRGIGENGTDLPEEFLRSIFDSIKENPFSLKEDDAARERVGTQKQGFDPSMLFDGAGALFGANADDRKRENFKKERDQMVAITERLIRRRPDKNSKHATSKGYTMTSCIAPSEVVMPMFDVTWGPILGILSQVLECSEDERSVAVCHTGFIYAVRLAGNSSMSLARDTFVSSLAKFTYLGSLKEMKRKNVESIRALLCIAVTDGECLGESWGPVLQCVSQLAKLRLTASGLDSDESFFSIEEPKKVSKRENTKSGIFSQPSKDDLAREAEESNAKAVLESIQEVLIDKVFSSTINLSAKSLAHFIEQLIIVSISEIEGQKKGGITGVESLRKSTDTHDGPSIFLMQRLVDVADHNMNVRPRLVWSQVWDLMAEFFAKNACHSNSMVSVFAIDSLRQLSMKFLDKPELSEFNFQSTFLKPFQVVMENNNSRDDVRELVLTCIDNIIRSKAQNLRSGWRILFSILTAAGQDSNRKIEMLGLTILQRLLDDHLNEVGNLIDKHTVQLEIENMTATDRRNRNANADDFIYLCKTSLAFLRFDNSGTVRPIGLSLRAFCHTAIYADLIAAKRVLPPVSGAQSTDPSSPGYTYAGLSDTDGLEMVLWRPLLEGLASGIKSPVATSESGVGCFIQRASVLALRAIFIRHGHLLSPSQIGVVLKDTLLPAIQLAAESDKTPVTLITSESPSISNIDFLVDSLPLPPDPDDADFLQFASENNSLSRALGPAELLLEASFTDLRHGGDGDLRKAYKLAKKSSLDTTKIAEQAFPDSWLAMAAPMTLGFLTDIVTEYVVFQGAEGRDQVWSLIAQQFRLWCIGRNLEKWTTFSPQGSLSDTWLPCETVARIACKEIGRLAVRLGDVNHGFSKLKESERLTWSCLILTLLSDLILESVKLEESLRTYLLDLKTGYKFKNGLTKGNTHGEVMTSFGKGKVLKNFCQSYIDLGKDNRTDIMMEEIALDFGALLFRPIPSSEHSKSSFDSPDQTNKESNLQRLPKEIDGAQGARFVPELKVRCVVAHCLQQVLMEVPESFVGLASEEVISIILQNLERSRVMSSSAVRDEVISTAFQESLLEQWDVENTATDESTESSARFTLLHGSAVFFLTQEASATKTSVHILSLLCNAPHNQEATENGSNWNRMSFAESHLVKNIQEIHDKFIDSERREGHTVDPSMWRSTHDVGVKVALYCTAFASVVVENLMIIKSLPIDRFERHKHVFFPMLCSLVAVQSDEIRALVQEIFGKQVAVLVGIGVN